MKRPLSTIRQKIQTILHTSPQTILLALWVTAAISLYNGLFFPYFGEEGVYTASSFEMLYNHIFTNVYFMGGYFGRPPLYNWLILCVAHLIGYKNMLFAARFVTITLTIGTSALTYWFTNAITQDKLFSLFSVLCFLSGDLLFRSSWVAYADPTFSFFTVGAICFMWVGAIKEKQAWLCIATPFLIAAFLTKALTCYAFYGTTALILLWKEKKWRYFFHPISIVLHLTALVFPFVWFKFFSHHQSGRMIWDLFHNFSGNTFSFKHTISQFISKTVVYFLRFAPLSFIFLYCLFLRKTGRLANNNAPWINTMALCVFINFLPYWLTPGVYQTRYLLPLFPFISILMAFTIYHSKQKIMHSTIYILAFFIGIKLCLSSFGLPWFEHMSYAYPSTAKKLLIETKSFPLYANDNDTLIATLDMIRYPDAPVVQPPQGAVNLFLIGKPANKQDQLIKKYQITDRRFGFYCRGLACLKMKKEI